MTPLDEEWVDEEWDVIIIGAGAAGLWAAGTICESLDSGTQKRVLLLEKNSKAGVKILMSGGTRCNITHACSTRQIQEAYGSRGRFLLSPLSRLGPDGVVREFQRFGVPSKVEPGGKVFPESDRAIDVRDALVKRLTVVGATICLSTPVTTCRRNDAKDGFEIETDSQCLRSRFLLITTGGLSYSGCGTTGDGYAWLRSMGHTITPLRPALTPILSPAAWVHDLSGITIADCSVEALPNGERMKGKNKNEFHSRGGFLWTHFGCSGPTAMNVSKHFANQPAGDDSSLAVDLLPGMHREQLTQWIDDATQSAKQKQVGNLLSERIPRRIAHSLLKLSGIDENTRLAELSKRDKLLIVDRIKLLQIPVCGTRGYPKAEVTAGGIDLLEVDSQSMQSRLVNGLYVAGEILDLDGPIGGYNFQAAWSTGHAAGLSIAEAINSCSVETTE